MPKPIREQDWSKTVVRALIAADGTPEHACPPEPHEAYERAADAALSSLEGWMLYINAPELSLSFTGRSRVATPGAPREVPLTWLFPPDAIEDLPAILDGLGAMDRAILRTYCRKILEAIPE